MSEDREREEDIREEEVEGVDPREPLEDSAGSDQGLETADAEEDVDEFDEMDEMEESEEEAPKEKGASLVIGQGDFTMNLSNRGADDPGDNTLSEPQFIHRYGDMMYVSDRGNHRVLVWEQLPEENGEPSSLVLGQEDFSDCLENRGITTTLDEMTSGLGDESLDGFTISKCEEDTLSQPAGIAVIGGKLFVVDSGNHRCVRWNGLPTDDGEAPNLVLGQDNLDCNEANRRGMVGSGSLFFPMGIHSGDDQHVIIADKDNHRVLIWRKTPFNNGWNADICLGQSGMDEREPNRGEFDNVQPDSLSFPTSVFYDAEEDRLFVVDQGNNRVLIWNKLPNANGVAADVVIGQKDFQSREPNAGQGFRRPNEQGLYFPTDVVCGKTGLFISDTGNNRVLYWETVPTENGQPADRVFGQTDFRSNKHNRGQPASAATLNDPFGMYLEEDLDDENYELEDEETAEGEQREPRFKLYIADRGNSRIVMWDELPARPGELEEEEEEGLDEIEMDDPDLPIGEDDDEDDYFLEEGEEEEPSEEVPSV